MRAVPDSIGVVGAGVIGLCTARLLQRRGHRVVIYTDRQTMDTTSARAGASFKPYAVAENALMFELAERSTSILAHLVATSHANAAGRAGTERWGGCGLRRHTHWEASDTALPDATYLGLMADLEYHQYPHVPGDYAVGRRFTTLLFDVPVYLQWLHDQFEVAGGRFVLLPGGLVDLAAVAELPHEIVFNCTGLGSRQLCADTELYPIRGQIALAPARPQMTWSISADGHYVYPRSRDTVIGGTAEANVHDEQPMPDVIAAIVQANRRILPDLTVESLLGTRAGLRPFRRGSIRIEAEDVGGCRIIHDYGHGGAGFTLSWGSAELAIELAFEERTGRSR